MSDLHPITHFIFEKYHFQTLLFSPIFLFSKSDIKKNNILELLKIIKLAFIVLIDWHLTRSYNVSKTPSMCKTILAHLQVQV